MKGLLAVCVVSLVVSAAAGQDRGGGQDIRDRFAGAWRLVSLERQHADGKIHKVDCAGLFVFTRDGHLSVQVMERNPQAQTRADPRQYSQGGYEASWGTYKVDEQARTFAFYVEGALVRTLIGKDLQRAYEFSGRQLIVKSTRPDEHWRVVWERY
jgi:hypothetical protein